MRIHFLVWWFALFAHGVAVTRSARPITPPPVVSHLVGWSGVGIAYSGDGTRILTAGPDGARVWDARTFAPISPPIEDGRAVLSAALSADGKRVFTATASHARLWDAQTGKPLSDLFSQGDNITLIACISPDFRRILTASAHVHTSSAATIGPDPLFPNDKIAMIWDADSGKVIAEIKVAGSVTQSAFAPGGKHVALAVRSWKKGNPCTVCVYDLSSGKPVELGNEETAKMEHPFAFNPDGKSLALFTKTNVLEIRRLEKYELVFRAEMTTDEPPCSLSFGPDGRKISAVVIDTLDGSRFPNPHAHIWEVATGTELGHPWDSIDPYAGADEYSTAGAISPDGKFIFISGLADRLWELGTDHRSVRIPADFYMESDDQIVFSPSGKQIAFAHRIGHETLLIDADSCLPR